MGHTSSSRRKRRMADDAVRSRSASPEDLSDADESWMVRLSEIKPLTELYALGEKSELGLKPAAPSRLLFKPDPTLLKRVSLFQGDITTLEIDAIVNAANRSLLGGGGVDGAIHAAAGPKLLDECRMLNGCLTGEAKITRGYNLPARHIIHTVGPVYSSSDKEEKHLRLESAYRTSLQVAAENDVRHIAFPSISTGIYSFPIKAATRIALETTRKFLASEAGNCLERVIFIVWSDKDKDVYRSLLPEYFPPGEREATPEVEKTTVVSEPTAEAGSAQQSSSSTQEVKRGESEAPEDSHS